MIPTLNCLASNITATLLSPWLPQSRRQTLPHILGKNKVFFAASTSVKVHSKSVRPICFLYCFIVVTYRSYHLRITFATWQKEIIPYFTAEELRHKEKFSEITQVLISIEMMGLRHLTDAQLLKRAYGCLQFEVRLSTSSEI